MPKGQKHVYGKGELHSITCSCFLRQPKLAVEKHRNLFVQLVEEVRVKFRFGVVGYVVMPNHFHLLMVEPAIDTAANSLDTLLQRYQRRYNTSARSDESVWQLPYSDTHVFQPAAIEERLRFMHDLPVKAGLVTDPTEWEWSSARFYAGLPDGILTVEPSTRQEVPHA
jgi:putative transposase